MRDVKGFNPFLNKKGELVNRFLNYQAALDDQNVSKKAKEYIRRATGLTPSKTAKENKMEKSKKSGAGYTKEYYEALPQGGADTGGSLAVTAMKYIGTPYVWGGESPGGFDCSGLMQYTFKQNGISIPRTAREQYKSGTAVTSENLQPGDLVFFKGSRGSATAPGHVGMYIGNGQYIQAPKTGDVVKISSLTGRNDYVGARRYR